VDNAIDGKEAKMVRYILPSVEGVLKLERRCPHCGRNNGRVHSGLCYRPVSDLKVQTIPQRRMKCPWCGVTWTLRAGGVLAGHHRSRRLEGIGVVLYMLGLSYRAVERFLPLLDCRGGKSSIERDVTGAGQRAGDLHRQSPGVRVRVLGVDGTGAAMAGRDAGVLFFVALDGRLIGVEPLHEEQTQKVRDHVAKVFAEVGARELRTDEHSVYEGIVPDEQHRLCLTHWRKSKGKRAFDLHRQALGEDAVLEAQTMEELLALLRKKPRAPTVPEDLSRLVRRYINAHRGLPWKVNQLLQHVERTWEKVSNDPVDPTNNITERMIGLTFKIRSKTMRGFKAMHKVLAHPHLAFHLRGQSGTCDLRKLV
jgi:transposase-like protein